MRIGILTFHRAYNCGAMLQAWALQTVLERMGHKVCFPFNAENEVGRYTYRNALCDRTHDGSWFRILRSFVYRAILVWRGMGGSGIRTGRYYDAFRERFLKEDACLPGDFPHRFDLVVIGSDQVINPRIHGWSEYCCGNRVHGVAKVMYAVSAGDGCLDMKSKSIIDKAIGACRAVSVREPYGTYPVVLDPTLLLDYPDYATIESVPRAKGFVFMYTADATEFEKKCAREMAAKLRRRLIIMPTTGLHNRKKEPDLYGKVSPDRMVGYMKNADYVISGSFHGTALAVVYHKPFIIIRNQMDALESRPLALLRTLGIADRLVNPSNTTDDMFVRLTRPLDDAVFDRLDKLRGESLHWLACALGDGCGDRQEGLRNRES